jgi:hypothetical protein
LKKMSSSSEEDEEGSDTGSEEEGSGEEEEGSGEEEEEEESEDSEDEEGEEMSLDLYPALIHEGDLTPDACGAEIDDVCKDIHAACKGFGTDEK